MNDGKGALSKMVSDEKFGKTLDSTMANLQAGTKGLSENMEAAKHNFLLKGFFKKKQREEAKKAAALKKQEQQKKKADLLNEDDGKKDGEKNPGNAKDSTKNR